MHYEVGGCAVILPNILLKNLKKNASRSEGVCNDRKYLLYIIVIIVLNTCLYQFFLRDPLIGLFSLSKIIIIIITPTDIIKVNVI